MSGPGQKPAAASVKGWCPGALRPMESGDGLLVRLRPRLARLSRAQVLGLCSLSETYGVGLIDLTRRANLQIRGVQPATYEPLIAALDGLGLLDADPAQESRRNLLVTPFWTAGDPTEYAARALLAALSSLPITPLNCMRRRPAACSPRWMASTPSRMTSRRCSCTSTITGPS